MGMARKDQYSLERWDDMQFVLAVARTGSFHAASVGLARDQSTASRRIRALERQLGVKLFDRHAHGMTLTPAGGALVERAQEMENAARAIERHLAGDDQRLTGVVQITAPDGLATHWLAPALFDFQKDHSGIQIELVTSPGPVNLLSREADIAIRNCETKDARTVVVKVGHLHFSLFAAPRYLRAHGVPATLEDLVTHNLVDHSGQGFTSGLDPWHELMRRHTRTVLRVNTSGAFLAAVRAGFGIGLFPNYYEFVSPDLTRVPLKMGCDAGIWLLSHEETNRNARVRSALDFLRRRFRHDRTRWFS